MCWSSYHFIELCGAMLLLHSAAIFAALVLVPLYTWGAANHPGPLYKDPKAKIEHRVNDLLGRMTVEEKVAQM
jgi:hypothetical protein